jgi:hypothetical protein
MGINGFDADLFDAAEFGDIAWVQRSVGSVGLDGKPIDINAQDERGVTILMIASRQGWIEIVRFLLVNGASPSLKDNQGQTALMKAQANGWTEIVDLLKRSRGQS